MPENASLAHSDAELLDRAGEGDEAAFTALYRRHHAAVRRLAYTYRLKGDPDDLVDATFAQVAEALRKRRQPVGSFRAHLFATLRQLAGRLPRAAAPGVAGSVPSSVEAVAGRMVLGGAERATIDKAFTSQSERWQVVTWHAVIDGCDQASLSRRLGVSPPAAEVQARRAVTKLRQAYLAVALAEAPRPSCTPYRGWLGAYARGALTAGDAEATRAHVDRCDSCRALIRRLDEVEDRLAWSVAPLFPHVTMASATGPSPVADQMVGREPGTTTLTLRTGTGAGAGTGSAGDRTILTTGGTGSGTAGRRAGTAGGDPAGRQAEPRHMARTGRWSPGGPAGTGRRVGVPSALAAAAAVVAFVVALAAVGTALTGGDDRGTDDVEVAADLDADDDRDDRSTGDGSEAGDDTDSAGHTARPPGTRPPGGTPGPTGEPTPTTTPERDTPAPGTSTPSSSTSSSSSTSTSSSSPAPPPTGSGRSPTTRPAPPTTSAPTTPAPTPTTPPSTGEPPAQPAPVTLESVTWAPGEPGHGELTVALARPVPLAAAGRVDMDVPDEEQVAVTVEGGEAVRLAARLDGRCSAPVEVGDLLGDERVTCELSPPAPGETVTVTIALAVDTAGQSVVVVASQDGDSVGTFEVELGTSVPTGGETP